MATLNQIKVNTGTEANPSYVLHDVHDKRLDDGASSLVTTCTHLLATNAALSSFNPITSANLASVLGGVKKLLPTKNIKSSATIDGNNVWYRIAQINFIAGSPMGSYLIAISSDYRHRQPSACLFYLSQGYSGHYFVQIGKRAKNSSETYDLNAVRVITKNHNHFVDIRYTVPTAGGNYVQADIFPLNNIISNITTVDFTDVTDENPGDNYTQLTPITAE